MKTKTMNAGLCTLLLLTIFFAGLVPVHASSNVRFRLSEEKGVASVIFTGTESVRFNLTIEDLNEKVVFYSESSASTSEYGRRFNLSKLENGEYKFIAKLNNEIIEKKFRVENSRVFFSEEKDLALAPPVFKIIDGYLLCYYINADNSDLSLRFFDSRGEEFFTDKDLSADIVHKRYKLSNLDAGKYNVVLMTETESYTYHLDL